MRTLSEQQSRRALVHPTDLDDSDDSDGSEEVLSEDIDPPAAASEVST